MTRYPLRPEDHPTECAGKAVQRPVDGDRWIPITERLPEEGASVAFVVDCKNPSFDLDGMVLGGRFRAGPYGGFGVPGLVVNASHWMPLPPPPTASGSSADARSDEKASRGDQPKGSGGAPEPDHIAIDRAWKDGFMKGHEVARTVAGIEEALAKFGSGGASPPEPAAWIYKYLGEWHLSHEKPGKGAIAVAPLYTRASPTEPK